MNMHKNAFANLLAHIPQLIEVRFHLTNLTRAVTQRIVAEVFASWRSAALGVVGAATDDALARAGLAPAAQQRFVFTALGDQLMRDSFGARLDQSLGEVYRRNGLDAALRRVDTLADGPLSQQRIERLSAEAVQAFMSELRHAPSFVAHERALTDAAARISELSEQLSSLAERNAERRTQLQQGLTRERQAQERQARDAAARAVAAARPAAVKWYEWRPWRRPADDAASQRPAAVNTRGGDETLLWEAALRQAVLEGEGRLLAGVGTILADELATDAQSLALLAEGERAARIAAESSEGVRDWGLPAGEILLNGPELTEATVRQLWQDEHALLALVFSKYAAAGGDAEATLTDEVVTAETVESVKRVVEELVSDALSDWTITDALAALSANDSDFTRRMREAFRQLTERDFLATGYDHIVPRASYAVITYAPSMLAAANAFLSGWVESLSQTVEVEFGIEADPLSKESLCCYLENFSVPLSALRFCEAYVEDEGTADPAASPLFTPHPDIIPVCIHAAVAKRAAAIEVEVQNAAD